MARFAPPGFEGCFRSNLLSFIGQRLCEDGVGMSKHKVYVGGLRLSHHRNVDVALTAVAAPEHQLWRGNRNEVEGS